MDVMRLVCRSWDDIVVGDALLWTFIYVDQYTSFDTLQLRLGRAGALLELTVVISPFWGRGLGSFDETRLYSVAPVSNFGLALTFVDDLFHIIRPLFHRCRHFELFTEDMRATRLFRDLTRLLMKINLALQI
jgi:hypothetical protein